MYEMDLGYDPLQQVSGHGFTYTAKKKKADVIKILDTRRWGMGGSEAK